MSDEQLHQTQTPIMAFMYCYYSLWLLLGCSTILVVILLAERWSSKK
jgi:hypothetical protein